MARASAGIVYSPGMMSVVSPYSAAVEAVIGPIEAIATRPRHARRSSSLNASAKLRAVDELVNVTASMAPPASASASRAAPPSALRVAVAGAEHGAQARHQPFRAVLGGHQIHVHAVLTQRVRRGRTDGGHSPPGH